MKKYFAKYLTVGGEIKKNDKLLQGNLGITQALTDNEGAKLTKEGFKKVKLFLCSKDIQVGDKVRYGYSPNSPEHICESLDGCKANGCWKVIGEISPDATWVKEGDEFDEIQILSYFSPKEQWKSYSVLGEDHSGKKQIVFPLSPSFSFSRWKIPENPLTHKYKIKGPCGHFH